MTNTTNNTTTNTTINNTKENKMTNTLEKQGRNLAKQYQTIVRQDETRFAKQLEAFDLPLGQLIQAACKQLNTTRLSAKRLEQLGIHEIDKRRRSIAKWFADNEQAARDFMKKSEHNYSNLAALQNAMNKAEAAAPVALTIEGLAQVVWNKCEKNNFSIDRFTQALVDVFEQQRIAKEAAAAAQAVETELKAVANG
jgi:hypothetical protein